MSEGVRSVGMIFWDSGAIHAGVYVDEETHRGSEPLRHVQLVLYQYRDRDVVVLLR